MHALLPAWESEGNVRFSSETRGVSWLLIFTMQPQAPLAWCRGGGDPIIDMRSEQATCTRMANRGHSSNEHRYSCRYGPAIPPVDDAKPTLRGRKPQSDSIRDRGAH